MPDIGLDLRFLRCAIVAAEQGSFRRAATALGISQASVSRRIDILEHRLGFLLFERMRTGIGLTSAGRHFLAEAAKGIGHFDRAVLLASSTNRGEAGVIHVGILCSLNSGHLREVVTKFLAIYPRVELVFHEKTSQDNLHDLIFGELDVSFSTGAPSIPGYLTEVMWNESVFVVLPSDHSLTKLDQVPWDVLCGEPFVVSSGGSGPEIHDYLLKRLGGFGCRPNISVQQVGGETLLNLVSLGYGLGLVSASSLGRDIPGTVVRPVVGSDDLEWSAVWSSKNANPALKRLLTLARSCKTVKKSGQQSAFVPTICPLLAVGVTILQIFDRFQ